MKSKLLFLFIAILFLGGCGESEKGGSDSHQAEPLESQSNNGGLLFLGVSDQSVRFGKLDEYVKSLDLGEEITAIAKEGESFWAGCASGTFHRLDIAGEKDGFDTLKIAKSFEVGCKLSSITPTPGRLWIGYNDCATKQPTIAEFDTEAQEFIAHHALGDPSDTIERVLEKDKNLYVLVGNGFSLIRWPISNPTERQTLDLREGSTGKYGKGDAALVGDQFWIFDSGKGQLMSIDIDNFSIVSAKSFSGFGASVMPRHCIGGEQELYCWSGENLVAFNPNGDSITGAYVAKHTIKHAAVIDQSLYIGYLASIDQLDGKTLSLTKQFPSHYGDRFIGVGR